MDSFPSVSNLCCELKIKRVKNIESLKKSSGDLFVRCFLSAENNRRIQLNTKEIPINSHMFWDDLFSLACLGNEESINSLREGDVIFELRCRNKYSVLGKLGGSSKLLGRAEFPWKNAFESTNMEIQTWVPMISKNRRVNEDLKPPAVEVSMKIRVPQEKITNKNDKSIRRWEKECECMACSGCHCCAHLDSFALGFALEAL